jgi:Zn2+/Cd2+-exporting ATPase
VAVLTLLGLPAAWAGVGYALGMSFALYPIALSGLNTLSVNRTFNINLLMTIATLGALLIGEYLEAATVIFFFTIGEALEGYTADRARASLRDLLALKPAEAIRLVQGFG